VSYRETEKTKPFVLRDGFDCDKCKKYFGEDDFVEMQEHVSFGGTGGYGAIWGDGTTWSVVLCQSCAYEILKPYIVIKQECGL
jgi:hypothetical protein